MFDPEEQLFCFRLKHTPKGLVRQGLSPQRTAIALMGLHCLEERGGTSPIRVQPAFERLLARRGWIQDIGDVALLLWSCALIQPERVYKLADRFDLRMSVRRSPGVRRGCTLQLSWLLSALSHICLAGQDRLKDFKPLAVETYERLIRNQRDEGLFTSYVSNKSLQGVLAGDTGDFADQVFSIYAFTRFAQAFGNTKAVEKALDCALTICDQQGADGQWWSRYDASNGRLVNRFPVFSMHQCGTAPMALWVLGDAAGADFSPWVHKGLEWLSDNELGCEMHDIEKDLIWSRISVSSFRRHTNATLGYLLRRQQQELRSDLKIEYECGPHELGWLIYAFGVSKERLVRMQYRNNHGDPGTSTPLASVN